MFQYILILFAVLAVVGAASLDSLVSSGHATEYVVAFGVALLLKPWLERHFE